ncbi:MAG: PilZ domain-containing protein [Methylocystis sp.]
MRSNLRHSINHFEMDFAHRAPVEFRGRFTLLKSHEQYPCRTLEMSSLEVCLSAPVVAAPGERVVLFLDELGRLPGTVLRATQTGFDMALQLTPKKRESIADQLAPRGRRSRAAKQPDADERIVPLMDLTVLRLTNGDEHLVRIKSLSLSGVALRTPHALPLGEEVTIGNARAKVVRSFDDGVVCEFVSPFFPGEINETTRL